MQSMEAFRNRQLETLPEALKRPVMFGGNTHGAVLWFYLLLRDLCWIDEREHEWNVFLETDLRGSRGVLGQFEYQQFQIPDYIAEIASVYAQVAHKLGYFQPERVLNPAEWKSLQSLLSADFFERDWTQTEIYDRLGPPSCEHFSSETRVACYAPEPAADWIFFDFSQQLPDSSDWFETPLLRDIRRKDNRLEFFPFADWCQKETEES
ncbi:MAG: hypothetical protein CME31_09460 [Gimesia sp.]|uniref:Uncharacterized protein n=1 Tax=Gimesia maris TaxID=122 RepID=A0A3D3R594_9PLAN|nr:hypothetical protein [Gimesia sp.]HCO24034.1 hypothetical protein [Gimesia maris]|tara:strand:+ start:31487 stop:32110 length:624 start_codon:yes stop_codon:yes gene_type:complete